MNEFKLVDSVEFFDNFLISEELINDVVDLFYKGDKRNLTINLLSNDGDTGIRGRIDEDRKNKKYIISLFIDTIRDHFAQELRIGGNFSHDNIYAAIVSVLVHEIQHGNQVLLYPSGTQFWKGNYYMRPAEVDARRFVDNNAEIIYSMLGVPLKKSNKDEQIEDADAIYTIVDIFSELDEVSISDIRQELSEYGLNNPFRVKEVIEMLTVHGTDVVKDYYND